jgi:hypothetical protein
MIFIEEELFGDKRGNLTFYEMLPFDFIGMVSWCVWLKGSCSIIRKRTATVRFYLHWIVMVFIEGERFQDNRRKSTVQEKATFNFIGRVVMTFIEWKLIHNKRMSFTFYEKLSLNFIGFNSWSILLKVKSSTIREGTWSFTKVSCWILLGRSGDNNFWW